MNEKQRDGMERAGETGEIIDRRAGERRAAAPVVAVVAADLSSLTRYHHNEFSKEIHNDPIGEYYLVADVQALASQAQAAVSAPVVLDLSRQLRTGAKGSATGDYVLVRPQMLNAAAEELERYAGLAAQAAVGVAKGDFLPTREVHEEIVLLSNVMREHPQLKSVIGREALLMRCVRKALAGEQQPQPSCMPPFAAPASQHEPCLTCGAQVGATHEFDCVYAGEAMQGFPGKGAAGERKIVGYGDCRCVLSQYCDGRCRPIFADEAVNKAGSAKGGITNDSCAGSPDLASIASQAQGDTELLNFVDEMTLSIRCRDICGGADDADVGFEVIEHHMTKPQDREIGFGNSVRAAIRAAIKHNATPTES